MRGHILTLGQRRRIAIDRRRTGVDHAPHTCIPCCKQHVLCAIDIRFQRPNRVCNGPWHRGQGSLMKYHLDAFHGCSHGIVISQITLYKSGTASECCQVCFLPCGKVIQYAHRLPRIEERLGDMRTNEARTTGNEISCCCHLPSPLQVHTCLSAQMLFHGCYLILPELPNCEQCPDILSSV